MPATDEERALMKKGAEAVFRARDAHAAGKPHHEVCVFCNEPLGVEREGTATFVHCPCGKSNATFKGL